MKITDKITESALLDKQAKLAFNLFVIFYYWIEGWLCNKDTVYHLLRMRKGGVGRDHHLLCGLVAPARI